ncbi:MAG TPA: DUF1444 family protein [Tepidisphaeraceae bacterium]|jgi:hypothetical protein
MEENTREQFAQRVIGIVRQRFPLVRIARADQPFSIRLNGRTASLENLYRLSVLSPDEVRHHVERWAVELLRDSEGTPDRFASLDEVRDKLMPMLVSSELDELKASKIVTQPVVEGLAVTYVLDGDRTIAYVPTSALERWGITVDELHDLALGNLIRQSQQIQAHAAQDENGDVNLILFQTMDGYDATRLLLPSLHDKLREHLGSPFAAAIPNRDILLCFRNEADNVQRIGNQVAEDYRSRPYQVTEGLFLVTADGVAPNSVTV